MKKVISLGCIICVVLMITGCVAGGSSNGSGSGLTNMKITVTKGKINDIAQLNASFNEAVMSQASWFLFEIRRPEGPVWIPANYEGAGVYTAETDQLRENYKLYGHLYAGGGFHFSEKYSP